MYAWNIELKQASKLSISTNDHSSAESWTGYLNLDNTTLSTVWRLGRDIAVKFLENKGFNDFNLCTSFTILRPFGFLLSIDDELFVEENEIIESDDDLHPLDDYVENESLNSAYITGFNGANYHKVSNLLIHFIVLILF